MIEEVDAGCPEFIWDTVAVNGDTQISQFVWNLVTNFETWSPIFVRLTVAVNCDAEFCHIVWQLFNLDMPRIYQGDRGH
jgi:hypothetical protein